MRSVALEHLEGIYSLYGEELGLRVARKHIGWYVRGLPGGEEFRREMNRIENADTQVAAVSTYFSRLAGTGERLQYALAVDGAVEYTERLAA